MTDLKRTPIYDFHVAHDAKMVPFAGYDMPVQYGLGVLKEHLHTREAAGLFDVSHMGQFRMVANSGSMKDAARALERLVPVDVLGLGEGRQRYGFLTNQDGGIEDDLMITNRGDHLFLVVNAARKDHDLDILQDGLTDCHIEEFPDRGLIALQGPQAEAVLAELTPDVTEMSFMDVRELHVLGADCVISRSGYTGEDGFELSVPAGALEPVVAALADDDRVEPIGLGARDSLRLEAGLCLYGHDIDSGTTPVEAGLTWAIQRVRRTGGDRAGGFPGAEAILAQLRDGAPRKRVGLLPEGRAPMREGTEIFADATGGSPIGKITSGGFGPSVGGPVSMGYVATEHASIGTQLYGEMRGKRYPAKVEKMPFTANTYKRN